MFTVFESAGVRWFLVIKWRLFVLKLTHVSWQRKHRCSTNTRSVVLLPYSKCHLLWFGDIHAFSVWFHRPDWPWSRRLPWFMRNVCHVEASQLPVHTRGTGFTVREASHSRLWSGIKRAEFAGVELTDRMISKDQRSGSFTAQKSAPSCSRKRAAAAFAWLTEQI